MASSKVPAVNPTATRAGMPIERSITAIDAANCWQNPFWVFTRKSSSALESLRGSTVWSYLNSLPTPLNRCWIAMTLS